MIPVTGPSGLQAVHAFGTSKQTLIRLWSMLWTLSYSCYKFTHNYVP